MEYIENPIFLQNGIRFIPQGYCNCQLSIVNSIYPNLPFSLYSETPQEKCRPNRRHFFKNNLLILVLALLVGDAAAGLAGRLAGGLALAAAAVLGALAQIAGLDGLNMLHGKIPPSFVSLFLEFTMCAEKCQSKNGTKHAPTSKLYHVFSFSPIGKSTEKRKKSLFSLPSCVIRVPMLLYRHKEVIPMI